MDVLMLRARWYGLLAGFALGACVPNVDTDDSKVTGPILLAVQATPAEASQGDEVTYRGLFVDQNGEVASGQLSWFDCTAPKPAAELGPVSQDCFHQERGKLVSIGHGNKVKGTMPLDACTLFGPNPPPPVDDGPPGRPADPDQTGGYKQPVIVGVTPKDGEGKTVLYEQRISCGLAAVSTEISTDYGAHYRANVNPSLSSIVVIRENGKSSTLSGDDVLEVSHGERVVLQAIWPHCPEKGECGDGICSVDESLYGPDDACPEDCTPPTKGCAGQEMFLWFNPKDRALTIRRESMSVAWYTTSGDYDYERTGVPEDQSTRGSSNYWTAPESGSAATLWVVVRDARGGVGYRTLHATIH